MGFLIRISRTAMGEGFSTSTVDKQPRDEGANSFLKKLGVFVLSAEERGGLSITETASLCASGWTLKSEFAVTA